MAVRERPDEKRLLIQLFPHVLDTFGDQVGGGFASGFLGEHGGGCGDRGFGRRLGLGDLGFRHLGAAGDEFLDLGLGLGGEPLGFGLGAGDNFLRLILGFVALALIVSKQRGGFVFKLLGLVEIGLDAASALVKRFGDHAMNADVAKPGHEQDEGQRHPKFGFMQQFHGVHRFKALATALATAVTLGAEPDSRSIMARAISSAIERTLAMAACLVAAIDISASATFVLSSSSSCLRVASAAASWRSRVSLAIDCARARASASAFS